MTNRTSQRIAVGSRWRGFSRSQRMFCAFMASLQLLLPSLVVALPTDGIVVGGNAEIQQISPTQLTIQQTTDRAILNWQSFSIGANETVRFDQPSINSIAMNRVTGIDPSVILGNLQANGRIFLLNPNGILFGAGAQINVGGLLATTLQIRDDDFMAGRFLFAQDPLKGLKSVVNQGTIHVSDHGFVVLAAPGVSNEGVIVASLGKVVLGSGQGLSVDLMGDGLIKYALSGKVLDHVMGVDGKPLSLAVSNTGTIQADGGHVILQAKASGDIFSSVVNQSGVVRAKSLMNHEGVVQLDGGDSGLVQVAGTVDASGVADGQRGGQVSVLGRSVELADSARINVSGDVGGGQVLVGGNYQGAGPELSAMTTMVAAGASINADAITQGDGGKVIVWADGHTGYKGNISARGGQSSGNGGFVEVSGKNTLDFNGRVDTSAPFGQTGTLLLDPSDITISTAANSNISGGPTFTGTALTSNLNVTTLQTALGTNNVIVDTTSLFASAGNITVSNTVTWASGNFLELRAHNNITVNAGISSTGLGILRLIGNQDGIGGGNVAVNAAISSRLGGIQLSGVGITSNAVGTITTTGLANQNAGNVTLNATGAVSLVGAITANGGAAGAGTPGRAGGTISITGATGVTTGVITASGSNGNGANQTGGNAGIISVTNTTSGNLTTGALTARTGNAVGTGAGGATGSITVTQNNAAAGAFLQTAAINTSGGTKGVGGAVVLNSLSNVNVTSTIATSGGAAVAGGTHAGAAAGNVTITGVNRSVTGAITATGGNAVGVNQVGGNAADVSITGSGTLAIGSITARTGAATGTGSGGTAGSVTLSGSTVSSGALNTSGQANGVGGNVTVTSATGTATLTSVTTSGGTANANTAGRGAGTISLTGASGLTATTITANGSNGNGANFAGGNGGMVNGTSTGGNVTVGAISAIGGSGLAGNANGGNGGAVLLDASGGTPAITHQNITTTGGNRFGSGTAGAGGAISIAAAALLSANTTLTAIGGSAGLGTGGNVTFGSTVNGNAAGRTLAVNSNGPTTFTGAVGGTQALGSLTTNATGTVQIGGNVTTTGVQTYGDPVTLIGNSIMTGTTPTFGSTVAGGGFNLTLNFSGATTINGVNFTGINNFATGNGGTTNLTGAFSTTGTQTYNDAVALTGATTLTSSGNQAVTFNNSVNGAQALAVNTTGTTTFGGLVGNTTALASLTTNTGGATALNGGGVTTTGAQTYNDAVTLGANITLNAGAGAITFGNTLNGAFSLAANSTGITTFSGAVGGATALISMTTNAGGTTAINGGAVTTSGAQTYNDAVTLGANTTLTGTTPTFGSTVTGGDFDLALNFSGTTTINGANFTGINNFATGNGGTTNLTGAFSTIGTQTYNDAVALTGATTVTSSGNQAITFNNTVNGAQALAVNTTGTTTFGGAVGGTTALTSMTTNVGGTTAINGGAVTTSGAQTYNDAVTLGANTTLTGTTPTFGSTVTGGGFDLALNFTGITTINGANFIGINNFASGNGGTTQLTGAFTTSGSQTYTDVVLLTGATTVASSGNQAISFNNTVNGAQDLTVNTGGVTTFGAAVGGTTALTSLTTDAGGITALNGGAMTTNGAQTYNDAVTLGAATVLSSTGGGMTLNGTLNGAQNLTLNAGAGDIAMNGIVGGLTSLINLTVATAANVTFGNSVTTTGSLLQSTGTGTTTLNGASIGGNLSLTTNTIALATAPIVVTGGPVAMAAANAISQNMNLTASGANMVTATTTAGSITMAPGATTTSGTGAINYTAGINVTLGSLTTGGAVNVLANGGSVLSAAGLGTNVTAGANSTLQAFNGVVGTQAAPLRVSVNPGTLSIRATTAIAGISAFLTGTVLPSNALTLLNVPPGSVCFNGCPVPPSINPVGGFFGLIPSFSLSSAIPWYIRQPSDPPLISVVSTYLPETVVAEAKLDVRSDDRSVARGIPPCYPEWACKPGASVLTAPADGEDPELPTAK